MVPIESSTFILYNKVCHVSNQRQTNLYAAVKNSTIQRHLTKTPVFFAESGHVVHTAKDTCQLFSKTTFIHKGNNFFTATSLPPETACHVYITYWRNRHKRCWRVPSIVTSWLLSSAVNHHLVPISRRLKVCCSGFKAPHVKPNNTT